MVVFVSILQQHSFNNIQNSEIPLQRFIMIAMLIKSIKKLTFDFITQVFFKKFQIRKHKIKLYQK